MKLVLAVVLGLVVGVSAVMAQAPAPPVSLAFATLDTGSAWYIYGATMAELLPLGYTAAAMPPDTFKGQSPTR